MNDSRYIALLVHSKEGRKSVLDRYLPFTGDTPVFTFLSSGINWRKKQIRGVEKVGDGHKSRKFSFPDVIYNTCYGDMRKLFARVERYIGSNRCFNWVSRLDKWNVHRVLSDSSINAYLPETYKYDRSQLKSFLQKYGCAFLKPRFGSLGKKIYRVASHENGQYAISEDIWEPRHTFQDYTSFYSQLKELMESKSYIIQKEIKLKKLYEQIIDMRVMVQKGSTGQWGVTANLVRFARKSFFVSNVFRYSDSMEDVLEALYEEPERRTAMYEEIRSLSEQVAQILEKHYGHLGELGIDIGIDENDRVWVIEVNGRPSKQMFDNFFDEAYTKVLYQAPIDYSKHLLQAHGHDDTKDRRVSRRRRQ